MEAAVWKWVEEFKSFSVLFCGGVVRSELDERVRAMRLVKQAKNIYTRKIDFNIFPNKKKKIIIKKIYGRFSKKYRDTKNRTHKKKLVLCTTKK